MEQYHYPIWTHDHIRNEPKLQHWINFFGKSGLYTTAERIKYVLNLNQSVFTQESWFIEAIQDIVAQYPLYKEWYIYIWNQPYSEKYRKLLPTYLHASRPTIHHIIFQNAHMWWHKTNTHNLVSMESWHHISFHALLNQKNYYPHQQLSKLLNIEQSILEPKLVNQIIALENTYHDIWKENPWLLYKKTSFQESWGKNYEKSVQKKSTKYTKHSYSRR